MSSPSLTHCAHWKRRLAESCDRRVADAALHEVLVFDSGLETSPHSGELMDADRLLVFVQQNAMTFVVKIAVAMLIWTVGRWIVNLIISMTLKALNARHIDATIQQYASTVLRILLYIILVGGIMGYVGIETASLAGLLAGAGLAIGMAWGGMLQNFAAGALLVVLRPFGVGDEVTIGEYEGIVVDIGLFMTTIYTWDRVHTFLGNNDVLGGPIRNHSRNKVRRVQLNAQLSYGADYRAAIDYYREKVAEIPDALSDPKPLIELIGLPPEGPLVSVRPYATPDKFWDVWFATVRIIEDSRAAAIQPGKPITLVPDERELRQI